MSYRPATTQDPTFPSIRRKPLASAVLAALPAVAAFVLIVCCPGLAQSRANRQYIKESCAEFTAGVESHGESTSGSSEESTRGDGYWVSWSGRVVSVDQTLWGTEVQVSCSGDLDGRAVLILSLPDPPPATLGIEKGVMVNFTGLIKGPLGPGLITVTQVEFIREHLTSAAPSMFSNTKERGPMDGGDTIPPVATGRPYGVAEAKLAVQQDIESTIREYFTAVEDRRIDRAVSLYAAVKRPKIKQGLLAAVARETQYYAIDLIRYDDVQPLQAKVTVELRHKKIDKPEEHWEIFIELVNEQGEWRILSTPGKQVR